MTVTYVNAGRRRGKPWARVPVGSPFAVTRSNRSETLILSSVVHRHASRDQSGLRADHAWQTSVAHRSRLDTAFSDHDSRSNTLPTYTKPHTLKGDSKFSRQRDIVSPIVWGRVRVGRGRSVCPLSAIGSRPPGRASACKNKTWNPGSKVLDRVQTLRLVQKAWGRPKRHHRPQVHSHTSTLSPSFA